MTREKDDDDFTPWTPAGADRLRSEARKAAAALIEHADTVAGLTERDFSERRTAGNRLLPFLLALSDAEFEYTGNGGPLGPLHAYEDEDEEEGQDYLDEREPPKSLSVLQRSDYLIVDEASVIEAGRAAYLDAWSNDTVEEAVADVTNIGRALYQIAHAAGAWSALDDVGGIEITGRVVVAAATDQPLGDDPDEWPEDPFEHDSTQVLYTQADVYRS